MLMLITTETPRDTRINKKETVLPIMDGRRKAKAKFILRLGKKYHQPFLYGYFFRTNSVLKREILSSIVAN